MILRVMTSWCQEGGRREGWVTRRLSLCTSSRLILEVFDPQPLWCISFLTLVEQEERQGRDVSAQSVYRRKPKAGQLSGSTGEKCSTVPHYFFGNEQKSRPDGSKVPRKTVQSNSAAVHSWLLNMYHTISNTNPFHFLLKSKRWWWKTELYRQALWIE